MSGEQHVASVARLDSPVAYRAECSCGWCGRARWRRSDAQSERKEHIEAVAS